MQGRLAYLLGLWLLGVQIVAGVEISDMTYICLGKSTGQLVPHPRDCEAYFECATVPSLRYCDSGLHFDALNSICDKPERAKCGKLSSSSKTDANAYPYRPQPVFMAVDVETGKPIDPMAKYDPNDIECRHFGAYFLPHPRSCHLYFLCAYGHLHRHQCGRGTHWSYTNAQCELRDHAECYSKVINDGYFEVDENEFEEVTEEEEQLELEQTEDIDLTPHTVCYLVTGDKMVLITENPDESITEMEMTTEKEEVIIEPQSSPPPPSPSASTPRAEINTLNCPTNHQSYLPHPEDCSRYYICIAGMPVLTSCPQGLYWDQKSGYCDLAKYVKCFQDA